MFNLFLKTLRDKRFFILGWVLGLLLLSYSVVILFPTFNDSMVDELSKNMPAAMQGFIGQLADLKQLDTFIGSQVYEVNLPIFIFVLTILLAIGVTVGEEYKGQLCTLIALPISRRKIIVAKWLAIVVISVLATLAITAGVLLGMLQIGETMDASALLGLTALLGLLTVSLATIIFAIGLATGSYAVTVTVGVVIAAGSYLLTTFSQGVAWLQNYEWLSILNYFPAPDIAKGVVEPSNILVYVGIIIISLLLAGIVFPRRDIKS